MSEDRSRPGHTRLDRALEELTAAPPAGALRARVLARIGSGDVARSRRSMWWSVALPVAAAVAVLTWATVWLDQHPSGPPARSQREPAVAVAPPVSPAPAASATEAPPTSVAQRAASSAPRSARRGRATSTRAANVAGPVSVVVTADDPPVLPALRPPPPVQAADITVGPIGEPAAIEVPGLRVEPLSSPDLNGSGLP